MGDSLGIMIPPLKCIMTSFWEESVDTDMVSSSKGNGNYPVNMAENVADNGSGVLGKKSLMSAVIVSVFIVRTSQSTKWPLKKCWEHQVNTVQIHRGAKFSVEMHNSAATGTVIYGGFTKLWP